MMDAFTQRWERTTARDEAGTLTAAQWLDHVDAEAAEGLDLEPILKVGLRHGFWRTEEDLAELLGETTTDD